MKFPPGSKLDAIVAETAMDGKWLRFHDADYRDPDEGDNKVHAFIVLPDKFEFFDLGKPRSKYVEDTGQCPRDRYSWIPKFSVEIAAAWTVFEKILEKDGTALLGSRKVWLDQNMMGPREVIYGETAPHAICLAALFLFSGVKVEA